MQFQQADLKDAHDRWVKANARSNTRKQKEIEEIQRERSAAQRRELADLSDINDLYKSKGRGSHLLTFDFEPTTAEPEEYISKVGTQKRRWVWKHKYTNGTVTRFATQSGKGMYIVC
jgi:hypothetical protein